MKERPILFNTPMVRATLDGSKMQTRQVMKPQPTPCTDGIRSGHWWPSNPHRSMLHVEQELQDYNGPWAGLCGDACPYGQPGDRLWVRETCKEDVAGSVSLARYSADNAPVLYSMSEDQEYNGSWAHWWYSKESCPSIHMPRWASRILLEITAVRVERLQDISETDAIAEGCRNSLHLQGGRFAKENFEHLWWTINGDESWEANPWVWVVEFKRVKP